MLISPSCKSLRWQECSHILVRARVGIQRHSGDLISELIERSRAAAAPPKTQTGLQNALFWALFSTEPWMQKRPKDWVLLYTGWQRWSEMIRAEQRIGLLHIYKDIGIQTPQYATSNLLHNSQSLASPYLRQNISVFFALYFQVQSH